MWRRLTIAGGVPAGAAIAYVLAASKPLMPSSSSVASSGQQRAALQRAHRQRLDFPRTHVRQHRNDRHEGPVQLAAQHLHQGRARALVEHDVEVDARQAAKERGGEMLEAARAAQRDLAGLRLRGGKHVLHRVGRKRRSHAEQGRARTELGDEIERLDRIVRQLAHGGIHHVGIRQDDEGIAVGRRPHGRLGADDAFRARAVVHDEGLAEGLREVRRDHAPEYVVRAPGRKRNDDPHGFRRIARLRRGGGALRNGYGQGGRQRDRQAGGRCEPHLRNASRPGRRNSWRSRRSACG